jgi:hypothetical protein
MSSVFSIFRLTDLPYQYDKGSQTLKVQFDLVVIRSAQMQQKYLPQR